MILEDIFTDLREESGDTVIQMAKKLNITLSQLADIERGHMRLPRRAKCLLYANYKLTPDQIEYIEQYACFGTAYPLDKMSPYFKNFINLLDKKLNGV